MGWVSKCVPVKLYECYLSMLTVYHNIYLFIYNVFLWADVMLLLLLCVCVIFCVFSCVCYFSCLIFICLVFNHQCCFVRGGCVCVCLCVCVGGGGGGGGGGEEGIFYCSLSLWQYLYMCTWCLNFWGDGGTGKELGGFVCHRTIIILIASFIHSLEKTHLLF